MITAVVIFLVDDALYFGENIVTEIKKYKIFGDVCLIVNGGCCGILIGMNSIHGWSLWQLPVYILIGLSFTLGRTFARLETVEECRRIVAEVKVATQ